MSSSKLRLWENLAVNDAVKHCIQIRENIENLAIERYTHIKDLPASLVPTDLLYNIVSCYEQLYSVAMEQELVKTGNLRTDKNNVH